MIHFGSFRLIFISIVLWHIVFTIPLLFIVPLVPLVLSYLYCSYLPLFVTTIYSPCIRWNTSAIISSNLSSNSGIKYSSIPPSLVFPKWGTGNPWGRSIHAEAKPFHPLLFQDHPQCSEGTNDPLSHGSVHFPWYIQHVLYTFAQNDSQLFTIHDSRCQQQQQHAKERMTKQKPHLQATCTYSHHLFPPS